MPSVTTRMQVMLTGTSFKDDKLKKRVCQMSREYEEHLTYLLNNFTQGGTPLPALVGSKQEWQVTTLVAGLLANANISASLDAEEIVEAAINYANIIQDKLGEYQNAKIHSLERLID